MTVIDLLSFDSFVVRAVAAGLGVALIAGPLGCFVVWRRMAYFGDTLSHAALTGVALGILLGVDPTVGIAGIGLVMGLLLLGLQQQRRISTDTLLGILSHTALSVGLIVVSFMDTVRFDLMGYLFGDILAVTTLDLAWIYGGGAVLLAALAAIWRPLIALTVDQDTAMVEGAGRRAALRDESRGHGRRHGADRRNGGDFRDFSLVHLGHAIGSIDRGRRRAAVRLEPCGRSGDRRRPWPEVRDGRKRRRRATLTSDRALLKAMNRP